MTDQEISAELQQRERPCDDLAFGVAVEIDHHVAQKDQVECPELWQRLVEIDLDEPHSAAELSVD